MWHFLTVKNKLEYARFIHLLMMYIVALLLFLFSKIPHSWWILLTTLMISAAIEPGLLVRRSIHRIKGTFLALFLLFPLLYLLQLNYRVIPIVIMVGLIGLNIAALNFKRYDIAVFFTTIAAVLLIAQSDNVYGPEGPIEIVINRSVCTLIGAMIVIFGDYFLFDAYHYSQKSYLLHQKNIIRFLTDLVAVVCDDSSKKGNLFLLIKKLRQETNENYQAITISADSLSADLKINAELKQQVSLFQTTIWELRRVIFALCFSELMLKSPERSAAHLARYHHLMAEARNHFIKITKSRRWRI